MKKKNLVLLSVVLCSFLIFSFKGFENNNENKINSSSSTFTNNNISNKFIFGAMHDEAQDAYWNYSHTLQLGFNISHQYVGWEWDSVTQRHYPKGRTANDGVLNGINEYKDGVRSILHDVYSNGERNMLLHRPKIEWLCYGHSSTYQCEPVSENNDLWFYSFNNQDIGEPYEEGIGSAPGIEPIKGMYCQKNSTSQSGFVIRRLKANTQQCNIGHGADAWRCDSECRWYVKPRIKADRNFIINPVNANTTVARVYVYSYKGYDANNPDSNRKVYKEIKASDFQLNYTDSLYRGDYLEEFYFNSAPRSAIFFDGDLGNHDPNYQEGKNEVGFAARGTCDNDNNIKNKTDIMIEWTNACDMWIDYVKVESDVAYELLKGRHDDWIEEEVSQIGLYNGGGSEPVALKFYIELSEFKNLPCMKYVNEKLKYYSNLYNPGAPPVDLLADFSDWNLGHVTWDERWRLADPGWIYRNYFDYVGFSQFFAESYPMTSEYKDPIDPVTCFSKIPYSLPISDAPRVLAKAVSPTEYDNWFQDNMYHVPYLIEQGGGWTTEPNYYALKRSSNSGPVICPPPYEFNQYKGNFYYTLKLGNYISRVSGKPFILMPQAHFWFWPGEIRREPTNEELEMMANVAISYGVKGLQYFWFPSGDNTGTTDPCLMDGMGVQEKWHSGTTGDFIPHNVYNQDTAKWKILRRIGKRAKKWEQYLLNFKNDEINSYAYYNATDRTNLLGTYFNDVVTFKPGSTTPCSEAASPSGLVAECADERYVQAATFNKNNETYTRYFMIVNTRCSPIKSGYEDGKRLIRVKFDVADHAFDYFNNWSVIDLETDNTVLTFDKRISNNIDLGWFEPGQGRLYKIAPTFMVGGTLVCDENISNVLFNCDGWVTANVNKNITIGENVTINFKDSVGISMTGANFKCGITVTDYLAPQKTVKFYSQSGMHWAGLNFIGLDTVIIQNTELKDIKSIPDLNEGYGINLLNTKYINIDGIRFDNTNSSAAGMHINYLTNLYMNPEINITNNTIKISTNGGDGIYIHPYSWLTLTPYIYANKIINTSSGGGEFGIFGFDLEGTAVKNNYIENFQNGILTWYSSLDLFENTIDTKNISNGWDLYGIVSEYNLSNAYESRLGGSNILTTKDGRNICLDALDINLTDGNNIFNVNDSSYGYHMAGYYPTSGLGKQNAYNNCFKIMGFPVGDEYGIRKNVTESDGLTQVTFDFGSFSCPSSPNYCDFYIGGTPTDTVWIECGGGMGGGTKNAEFRMQNSELEKRKTERASAPQTLTYKEIYDSLSINMRKRQYELAAEKCIILLDNYPDSAKVINCVDKLYRTALVRNKVSELKSYYEAFIQNHPNNTQIISRMFYYIQKAKAKLGQYQSALQGFQTIMNQFPTSYEGLAARWDYMATQLIDTSSGSGGGEQLMINNEQLTSEQEHERLVNLVEDPLDKYDKKKFTKEDRKVIVNNIVSAFETQKTKEVKKLKELEVKITKNEANESEKKEYKTKSKLKEVVKPQKVRNISEQIAVVQGDIKKVFPLSERKGNIESKITAIPLEYKLSQNYPNPFNPTTKINYEIPKVGFVSIKIYDLLGREIAELVNENKDAGRYTIDFNASKYLLASGIYFYRIKAGEFIDTKRMVLVK